jgi:hypothetical protein
MNIRKNKMIFNFKGEKVFYMVKQHIITQNIAWLGNCYIVPWGNGWETFIA